MLERMLFGLPNNPKDSSRMSAPKLVTWARTVETEGRPIAQKAELLCAGLKKQLDERGVQEIPPRRSAPPLIPEP